MVVTISLSPQGQGLKQGLWKVKSHYPAIPVGGGAMDTNDWWTTLRIFHLQKRLYFPFTNNRRIFSYCQTRINDSFFFLLTFHFPQFYFKTSSQMSMNMLSIGTSLWQSNDITWWQCVWLKLQPTYSKTCLKQPLKKKTKIGFQDRLSLNAGQKYCRMLQESILQYFRPSLCYYLSLRPLFCLFLSGCLRQVYCTSLVNALHVR